MVDIGRDYGSPEEIIKKLNQDADNPSVDSLRIIAENAIPLGILYLQDLDRTFKEGFEADIEEREYEPNYGNYAQIEVGEIINTVYGLLEGVRPIVAYFTYALTSVSNSVITIGDRSFPNAFSAFEETGLDYISELWLEIFNISPTLREAFLAKHGFELVYIRNFPISDHVTLEELEEVSSSYISGKCFREETEFIHRNLASLLSDSDIIMAQALQEFSRLAVRLASNGIQDLIGYNASGSSKIDARSRIDLPTAGYVTLNDLVDYTGLKKSSWGRYKTKWGEPTIFGHIKNGHHWLYTDIRKTLEEQFQHIPWPEEFPRGVYYRNIK